MSDDLMSMRVSELTERLREAWDEGFAEGTSAGRGDEYTRNPHVDWCPVPNCSGVLAAFAKLCASHESQLCALLDAAGIKRDAGHLVSPDVT